MWSRITVYAPGGSSIETVVPEAIALATRERAQVLLRFNNVQLLLSEGDDWRSKVDEYHCIRRRAAEREAI